MKRQINKTLGLTWPARLCNVQISKLVRLVFQTPFYSQASCKSTLKFNIPNSNLTNVNRISVRGGKLRPKEERSQEGKEKPKAHGETHFQETEPICQRLKLGPWRRPTTTPSSAIRFGCWNFKRDSHCQTLLRWASRKERSCQLDQRVQKDEADAYFWLMARTWGAGWLQNEVRSFLSWEQKRQLFFVRHWTAFCRFCRFEVWSGFKEPACVFEIKQARPDACKV